jgi:hypothetical protein
MDGLEGDFRPNESWGTQAVKPQPKRLREDRLRKFVADLFAARGMSSADAASVAEVLVWADLRGGETHGISRIPHYFGMIDKGALKPGATPVVTRDFGALVGIDAQGAAGPVAMKMALAEAKARGDQDAEDEFLIEQAEKMAKATPKKPPAQGEKRVPAEDDDVPY